MENLRYMLVSNDPKSPIYFGLRFKPFTKQGYMSGGAGYVLSKEALKRFVEQGLPNEKICKKEDTGAEDAEMGICLDKLNVTAGDSRDVDGSYRFFSFGPEHHLTHKKDDFWYWSYIYYDEPPVSVANLMKLAKS